MHKELNQDTAAELLKEVDTFIFDCDGVLWAGAKAIEGATEMLQYLHTQGKKVFFVTNNSTKSRLFYCKKLHGKGLAFVQEGDILNSAYAAAELLSSDPAFEGKAYVIGENGVYEELEKVGITPVNEHRSCPQYEGEDLQPLHSSTPTALAQPHLEEGVGAVLVAFDRYFNYTKLSTAMRYLQDPKCLFYATNTDVCFPTSQGVLPGSGTFISMLETCTGRTPVVAGKPSLHLMEVIRKRATIDPARTIMVGDRLETDILFGRDAGIKTLLVFSGVTSKESLDTHPAPVRPDYTASSVAQFLPKSS